MYWLIGYAGVALACMFYFPRKAYQKGGYDREDKVGGAMFFSIFWPVVPFFFGVFVLGLSVLWITIPEFRKDHPLQLPWKT